MKKFKSMLKENYQDTEWIRRSSLRDKIEALEKEINEDEEKIRVKKEKVREMRSNL